MENSNYTVIVLIAFAASIGMTCVILACALPVHQNWWPMIVALFYLLLPLPTMLSHRYNEFSIGEISRSRILDFGIFITIGLVVSSFALPIILARGPEGDPAIQASACYLTLTGNVIVFSTYAGYFLYISRYDDGVY